MLILLSPAKNMNFDPAPGAPRATKPALLKDAAELSETTRKLTRSKIRSLMRISEKLADLNFERFQAFDHKASGARVKQAALSFNGDVYLGLEAGTLTKDDLAWAQDHLRILSGLYGVLRPLDGIQPYRLEMGSRLKTPRGANLYAFWGEKIARELNRSLKGQSRPVVVNLASNEYFSAVDREALGAEVVTPVFKEEKDGALRQLQFFAKRARGLMARWIIENRIDDPDRIKDFDVDGYSFRAGAGKEGEWLFARPQPAPKGKAKAA